LKGGLGRGSADPTVAWSSSTTEVEELLGTNHPAHVPRAPLFVRGIMLRVSRSLYRLPVTIILRALEVGANKI
jgi:hypothetical protein